MIALRSRPTYLRAEALLVAAPLAMAAPRAENPLHFLLLAGFGGALVALALCDAHTKLLPNRIMYPALIAALLCAGAWPDRTLVSAIAGGLVGGGGMLVFFLVLPGFGAGDVKLCALIGLLVGWPHVLGALFLGLLVNGALALIGLAAGKLRLRQAMPFGPGLIAGALFMLFLVRP